MGKKAYYTNNVYKITPDTCFPSLIYHSMTPWEFWRNPILDHMRVTQYYRPKKGPSWPWSYSSWVHNYQCNRCPSPLMLWVKIPLRARCTTLYDQVCQWLVAGQWFSPGTPVSSTNKTDRHEIAEILLKVALNTINQTLDMS